MIVNNLRIEEALFFSNNQGLNKVNIQKFIEPLLSCQIAKNDLAQLVKAINSKPRRQALKN